MAPRCRGAQRGAAPAIESRRAVGQGRRSCANVCTSSWPRSIHRPTRRIRGRALGRADRGGAAVRRRQRTRADVPARAGWWTRRDSRALRRRPCESEFDVYDVDFEKAITFLAPENWPRLHGLLVPDGLRCGCAPGFTVTTKMVSTDCHGPDDAYVHAAAHARLQIRPRRRTLCDSRATTRAGTRSRRTTCSWTRVAGRAPNARAASCASRRRSACSSTARSAARQLAPVRVRTGVD